MACSFKSVMFAFMLCLALTNVANFAERCLIIDGMLKSKSITEIKADMETKEYRARKEYTEAKIVAENKAEPKVSTSFDSAVKLAYHLINTSLPRRDDVSKAFDISKWDKETNGGLMPHDREYLGKIYGEADSVFEYGLGESTYIADHAGVRRYAGVDSDAAWVSATRDKVSDHFRFYFADIGPTKAWGRPENDGLTKSILSYQLTPLIVEVEPFDVYMVDGRWRLPCMIVSFLHASARGALHNKTVVLMHDCNAAELGLRDPKLKARGGKITRPVYRSADHMLDIVDHSGDILCVYKRKPETTDEQLLAFWKKNYQKVN